ncbi:MAG: hypothetical protein HY040_21915 [Planctomycetes bacterium]|nr:hypothetical protein [Planctomycetota bacterium]
MSPIKFKFRSLLGIAVVGAAVAVVSVSLAGGGKAKEQDVTKDKGAKSSSAPTEVEAQLRDDSTIKLILHDKKVELHTAYGNLEIPVSAVARIDFGIRLSADEQKRASAAITELGHADKSRRDAATAALLALREKALPALVKTADGDKPESAQRAEETLAKLRESLSKEEKETTDLDVVYTATSKFSGRIKVSSFKVSTLAFGDQELKLTTIRTLSSLETAFANDGNALVHAVSKDGLKLEDKLADGDTRHNYNVNLQGMALNMNLRMKTYQVRLGAGKHLIEVKAGDEVFDPLLVVYDKSGEMLAYDDDSGGALDSMLEFDAGRGGVFTIHVAGMRDTLGPYTLKINARRVGR